ncbi:hypothetical protein POM88_048918 [Heracleum sosnowskyi]|uniref:Uncharacterized protein n=1 Tax=Heracleum sosnowskyi TaxID=360622 RepID=A0AAD8GWS7_9APIA|nr:hypothetical protein POM88_048918 [Heracleum sosnowskyi]
MILVGWRLCKLYEAGKMTAGQASLGKSWNTAKAREVVSLGRELLGGNGILADFLVAKRSVIWNPFTHTKAHMKSTPWSQVKKSLALLVSRQQYHYHVAVCNSVY